MPTEIIFPLNFNLFKPFKKHFYCTECIDLLNNLLQEKIKADSNPDLLQSSLSREYLVLLTHIVRFVFFH